MNETPDPKTILAGASAAGVGLGWLLNFFQYSKKIGRQEERIDNIDKRLVEVELELEEFEQNWRIEQERFRAELQVALKEIRTLLEVKVQSIESYFWDGDKNPRILTVTQHEKICGDRKEDMLEIKGHVEEIFKTLSVMGRNIAVLSDRRARDME